MLSILFEDEDMIVLNKPAGLLSIPDRFGKDISLKSLLIEKYGEIFTVHRLDQYTSGLIVFAKNAEAHKLLSELFEGREIEKKYLGLVLGRPPAEGSIDQPIMEHPVKKGTMVVHAKVLMAQPILRQTSPIAVKLRPNLLYILKRVFAKFQVKRVHNERASQFSILNFQHFSPKGIITRP